MTMISFADLLPRLGQVEQLGPRDYAFTCHKCGGRASVKSFGRRWSAKCEACGELGEDDIRVVPEGKTDPGGTVSLGEMASAGRVAGVTSQYPQAGSGPARPTSEATQPAQEEDRISGDIQEEPASPNQQESSTRRAGIQTEEASARSQKGRIATASVGEADAHAGNQASEEVMRHRPQLSNAGAQGDNATPAAGSLNGAGSGRAYHGRPKTQPDKALVPSRAIPAADDILRRKPPQDIEAEQSVLGAILLDNEAIARIGWLSADSFYREAHREIYRAFLSLRSTGDPIDAVTLAAVLRARGVFEAIGGASYIIELADVTPTAANIQHYAAIVRDMALKRDIATRATQLATLAYNGVSADGLVGEMERLLKPIAQSNSPELPALITRDIEIVSARDFHARNSTVKARQWLVDGLIAKKEISLWSGKVEHGKTTLLRTLCMCVLKGEFFLERHTYPSRVLYVMLDADGEDLTYEEFNRLGLNWQEEPIDFLVDPVMAIRPRSFEQFHGKLLDLKPDLVIIDPLGRFQKTEMGEMSDYSMTYAMARLSELAKQADCHILLLHHIPRGRNDAEDPATAGFGSIAIAGGCNARFSCIKKAGGIYTIRSSQGKGGGFVPFETEMVLDRDAETHWVTLRGPYDWKAQAQVIEPAVLEAIEASDEWLGANDLGKIVGVQRSIAGASAKSLERRGLVQMKVTKANKHLFARLERQGEFEESKAK